MHNAFRRSGVPAFSDDASLGGAAQSVTMLSS